ncbi:hypothetical protein BC628DRAFT_1150836, partial [Trametes gibbosa]
MSAEYNDATLAQIREVISRLQSPIPDLPTLLSLLTAPLASIGLLPPRFRVHDISPLPPHAFDVARHAPLLQRALLEHVIPTWEPALTKEDAYELVEQYFSPDSMSFASPAAKQVALCAYSTIVSTALQDYAVRILAKLVKAYPVDVLYISQFSGASSAAHVRHAINWEDHVRNVVAVPTKVANFMGERRATPSSLEYGPYFADVSVRIERLVYTSRAERSQDRISAIAYLLAKLANTGAFPSAVPTSLAQPSFFEATLPAIRLHLQADDDSCYSAYWTKLLASLPSTMNLRSILTSLFAHLARITSVLDTAMRTRALVVREAWLVKNLFGPLHKDNSELVDCFAAVIFGRNWDEGHARIFACWAAGAQKDDRDREALETLLARVIDVWTDVDHVRHSLLSQHQYVTSLLLITLKYFPPPNPAHDLTLSPSFVQSISTYISHLDPSIRRCGMLVAEEVARASGKSLNFGDWEGDGQGKLWCRRLRGLLQACDADVEQPDEPEKEDAIAQENQPSSITPVQPTKAAIIKEELAPGYDSDDSLTGYASPPSSRSASPTPSDLEEIERDPTIRVGVKKVPRPVYLAQLGEMIRPTGGLQSGDEQLQATKVEVALEVAEELIRRKSGYGTEL